ncbi:TetR/AcrR family transcriptional regulator [Streptomyces flavofungini]|uniref:TetR/AcrR family transcriptional regulator n=1 Tax=Streptomyces flavofungini TaxID=68200 RepID=A0ABS0X891_9ACTN|nr:TetR/AcrR family transcriptional regulator [Streptomyces flavofungini]MBJ3809427.1 TetR/AcrR family transcriptional regulator [Streptomyces flavofungini]
MSDVQRARIRLQISREAARLFWDQGVAATSGDQIAEAVGVSTRTIWRHFRNKESCAEPVIMQGVVTLLGVLSAWPKDRFLEDHLKAELARLGVEEPPVSFADEMLATQMIWLADTEPALRASWLMACDQTERELGVIIGNRLGLPPDDLEVRQHAAAAAAVIRIHDEHIGAAIVAGADVAEYADVEALSKRYAHAIRTATGGAIGDPVI